MCRSVSESNNRLLFLMFPSRSTLRMCGRFRSSVEPSVSIEVLWVKCLLLDSTSFLLTSRDSETRV